MHERMECAVSPARRQQAGAAAAACSTRSTRGRLSAARPQRAHLIHALRLAPKLRLQRLHHAVDLRVCACVHVKEGGAWSSGAAGGGMQACVGLLQPAAAAAGEGGEQGARAHRGVGHGKQRAIRHGAALAQAARHHSVRGAGLRLEQRRERLGRDARSGGGGGSECSASAGGRGRAGQGGRLPVHPSLAAGGSMHVRPLGWPLHRPLSMRRTCSSAIWPSTRSCMACWKACAVTCAAEQHRQAGAQ